MVKRKRMKQKRGGGCVVEESKVGCRVGSK